MQSSLSLFRRLWRVARLLSHLLLGVLLTLLLSWWLVGASSHARLGEWWCRRLCAILKVSLHVQGRPATGAVLQAVNHISWLDIPVLGAVGQAHFLAKSEVSQWPLIGWLARYNGTLFIERGRPGAVARSTREVARMLERRRRVLFFPEGTTTHGDRVRRFHRQLFVAAQQTDSQVQPVALRYLHPTGVHPRVPYVGSQTFMANLWAICAEPRIRVELIYAAPFAVGQMSPKQAAERAWLTVNHALWPEVADAA